MQMELLIILIIVIVLCFVLDISMIFVAMGLVALIGIISGLFALAFWGCIICLLGSERKEATFMRIDKGPSGKFKVAYYLVEGQEYPCIFPKEAVLESKLYRTDKTYQVLLHKKIGKVFDRFAVLTCVIGTMAGTILSVVILLYFLLD